MSSSLVAVDALRLHLERQGLWCFVVPTEDPHDSEYVAAHFKRRAWISGFNGSAGTAIVCREGPPLLFVDPRYWQQAEVCGVIFLACFRSPLNSGDV
jgi:Xaa-Pro aminopeptidase